MMAIRGEVGWERANWVKGVKGRKLDFGREHTAKYTDVELECRTLEIRIMLLTGIASINLILKIHVFQEVRNLHHQVVLIFA